MWKEKEIQTMQKYSQWWFNKQVIDVMGVIIKDGSQGKTIELCLALGQSGINWSLSMKIKAGNS